MASPCLHFKHLRERVDELERKFILDQVASEASDPLNFQPDLDRLAAFRLLVHAEIEDFLESKAKENLASLRKSLAAGVWMRGAPQLIALAVVTKKALPTVEWIEQGKFATYVEEIVQAANSAISENNGVKSGAFLFLSLCAGKTLDEIDSVLSNSLNSYGKGRGDVAHKSVIRSTSLQAPSTESATVNGMVNQLGLYFDVCV